MQLSERTNTPRSQTGTPHYVYSYFDTRVAHAWTNRRLRTWHHPLLVPAYVATVSAVILLLQVSFSSPLMRKYARRHTFPVALDETPDILSAPLEHTVFSVKRHIAELGGPVIFWMNVTRAMAVFILLGISIASFSVEGPKLALSLTYVCELHTFLAKSRLISRDSVLCFGVGYSCCI